MIRLVESACSRVILAGTGTTGSLRGETLEATLGVVVGREVLQVEAGCEGRVGVEVRVEVGVEDCWKGEGGGDGVPGRDSGVVLSKLADRQLS